MYKTILALALIATVAFANSAADRYFPNDDVDYVIQGKNGRPLGISFVNMDEVQNLQESQEEYLDDDEDYEYTDSIDQNKDDLEDMIFMWNTWRSSDLTGSCWRNGYSRGLAVGGVFGHCGLGYFGLGPMCYFNNCPFGKNPCGALCIPFMDECTPELQAVQRAIGNCMANEVTSNAGIWDPTFFGPCSGGNVEGNGNGLAFCNTPSSEVAQVEAGDLPVNHFTFMAPAVVGVVGPAVVGPAVMVGPAVVGGAVAASGGSAHGSMSMSSSHSASMSSGNGGGSSSMSMGMSSSHSVSYLENNSLEELQLAQNGMGMGPQMRQGPMPQGNGTPITTGQDQFSQQNTQFNGPNSQGFSKKTAFKSTRATTATTTTTTGATANFVSLAGLAAVALLTKYFY